MKEVYVINPELPVIKEGWKGNLMIDNQFCNTRNDEKYSFWEIMRWQLSGNPQKDEKKADTFRLKVVPNDTFTQSEGNKIVWFGHSSFYIKLGTHTFVTDPIFYNAIFMKRHAAMPCNVDKITGIQYLLLSHNHRDHINFKSIKALVKHNPKMEGLFPLKLNKVVGKFVTKSQEAGWYQQYKTDEDLKVYFLPTKHWSKRGLFDMKKSLWGSYIIEYNGTVIYFAGDCAFVEDNFMEIKKLFPKIDYALIPVGAYKPPYIMKRAHISPEEAVEISNILDAKFFIPMHYGTIDLSDEPMGEPVQLLLNMQKEGKIKPQLKFLDIGEELRLK